MLALGSKYSAVCLQRFGEVEVQHYSRDFTVPAEHMHVLMTDAVDGADLLYALSIQRARLYFCIQKISQASETI